MSHPLDEVRDTPWGRDVNDSLLSLHRKVARMEPGKPVHENSAGMWAKWQTFVMLLGMATGFIGSGALYLRHEGERDAQIGYIITQIQDFSATRYTKDDAVKDQAVNTAHYNDVSERLRQLEYRANRTEAQTHDRTR